MSKVRNPAASGRPRRVPMWATLSLVFGCLLMLFSGAALIGGRLVVRHYGDAVTRPGGLGRAAAEGKSIDGPINLLLVGVDERAAGGGVRADSIMIAHVPASHDAMYLTSIPRDSKVTIPANPKTRYGGGVDKINAAFQYGYQNGGGRAGGLELLAETVSELTGGLKFNGAAIVNFDGFQGLVRAVGGVHMCVDERVTSIHIGWDTRTGKEGVPYYMHADGTPAGLKPNMRPKVYEVECRDFSAWEALDYVRQRDLLANNDGDYGRQRHQQQFVKAMMARTKSIGVITNPLKVNAVLNSVGQAVSFYNNNIPVIDWIFTLKGISPENTTMLKMNGGAFHPETYNGQSVEVLDDDSRQLLRAIANDDVAGYVSTHPTAVNSAAPGG
jgi:LCP family protein required for cell wall assembly